MFLNSRVSGRYFPRNIAATAVPISATDTYRHRPDCTKLKTGALGCDSYGNWPNFKGEWTIPVGDAVAGATPGGNLPGGGGWVGEVPVGEDQIP